MKSLNQEEAGRRHLVTKTFLEPVSTWFGSTGLFRRKYCFTQVTYLFIIVLLSFTMTWSESGGQDPPQLTLAEARKIIADGNRQWGKARVEFDNAMFEKMLAPDFYVQLPGRRLTRQEFIESISVQRPDRKLTRFDATVLTVQRTAADEWVAVIHEKLEIERPDGKLYSLWITRDGWKKVDGQWVITFSEAIGNENWSGGEKPPFQDW